LIYVNCETGRHQQNASQKYPNERLMIVYGAMKPMCIQRVGLSEQERQVRTSVIA
jgi:hypothetical protein